MSDDRTIEVRLASSNDQAAVSSIVQRHEQHRAGNRGADSYLAFLDSQELLQYLEGEGPPWVLLALDHDRPVGIAALEVRSGTGVRHAVLRCLFGAHEVIEAKVEEQLLIHTEELARNYGCDALDIEVLPGDQPMKSLLEESGYKARLLIMHRSLGGN